MPKKFDSLLDDVQRGSIQAYFKGNKPEEKKADTEAEASKVKPFETVEKEAKKHPLKASPTPSEKLPVKRETLPPEATEETKENRSKRISVLTTPEIFKNVNALAFLYGISVNEIINSQVEKYIAENDKDLSFALEVMSRKENYRGGKK